MLIFLVEVTSMSADKKICFFLGANSPQGFYSLYDQLIDPAQARAIYI